MADSELPEQTTEDEKKFNVRVTISSLGNERRVVNFQEMSKEETQRVIAEINKGFGTVRASTALLLTDSDGQIVFSNLDNVAFIEVHIV